MRIVRITENVAQNGVLRLHHITDIHAGAPDFAEQELQERVALIKKDPSSRWVMGGDGGDLIRHSDRRYSPTELDMRYRMATDVRLATKEHLVELLEPIADKCWGWADGNHERAMDEHNGGHFGVEVCCDLGVEDKFVGYNGFVHVMSTIGGSTTRIAQLIDLQHGWQAGRLKGAPLVQAERELGITGADIVLRGHNHSPMGHVFMTRDVTHGHGDARVTLRPRSVINGGTWRKGFRDDLAPVNKKKISEVEGDLWHETKGFRSEPTGGPVLIIRFDKGEGSEKRKEGRTASRPAGVQHTVISGHIDEHSIGLK